MGNTELTFYQKENFMNLYNPLFKYVNLPTSSNGLQMLIFQKGKKLSNRREVIQ